MKKQEKKREMRVKRFWKSSSKTTSSEDSAAGGYDSPTTSSNLTSIKLKSSGTSSSSSVHQQQQHYTTINNRPTCSLPLLQVWPSQDSPHGEGVDSGKSFIFPLATTTSDVMMANINELDDLCVLNDGDGAASDNGTTTLDHDENFIFKNKKKLNRPSAINSISGGGGDPLNVINNIDNNCVENVDSNYTDGGIRGSGNGNGNGGGGDSGIESIQASPLTNAYICLPGVVIQSVVQPSQPSTAQITNISSSSPLSSPINQRHQLLPLRRPSSALLHPDHARLLAMRNPPPMSPNQSSIEDFSEFNRIAGIHICATSSSTTSSLTSIAAASINQKRRLSDPWLHIDENNRRRSSTLSARYSLFDALDLEYALLHAAARGSVGPYSLNESFHKLTFTQSLAFPALARGLATHRRRRSIDHHHSRTQSRSINTNESGFNIFAKVVTAVVLMLVSFLVFLVIYKFVRT